MASRRAHVKEISFKTLVNMLEQDGEEAFPIIQFNGTNHYMAYVQAGAGPVSIGHRHHQKRRGDER
jgi:hypothetical protein